ncbi:alkaline-phosphatase-like protein [Mrakia frigida]|uniref:alkaline phosphatase n=1 Tax=Mrakia frigida TaxID=29902 RepID=UPI003FCC1C2E
MSSQQLLSGAHYDSTEEEMEEDILLLPKPAAQHKKKVVIGLATTVVVLLGLLVGLWQLRFADDIPRTNMILMISDGFGPASETFARDFYKHLNGLSYQDKFAFPLDNILVGSSRTRSSNSLVTDSAAGATAFSCMQKSYNGAISVEAEGNHRPCGTVMEAAKADGYTTGLVVTSRITHATPACFYSHVVDRDMESEIAEFLVGDGPMGHVVDLALGGGRCFFYPNSSSSSCRTDGSDLFASADLKGTNVLLSRKEYDSALSASNGVLPLPLIGLFNQDHLNYDIDRPHLPEAKAEPSLKEMAATALKTLNFAAKSGKSGKEGKGFFLMIEGSRIDMGAHSNDPANHARDIFMYQETVQLVLDWIDALPAKERARTVMLSTSDHETGGLTLARQLDPSIYPTYAYYPSALENVTRSTIFLGEHILTRAESRGGEDVEESWVKEQIFGKGLGIEDGTDEELERVRAVQGDAVKLDNVLADMVSRRAQLGWSTHGHSGVDVNLYMYPRQPDFHGSKENTEVGEFIAKHLKLDLEPITTKLNADADSWFHWETTSGKEKGGQQKKKKRGVKHFHSCQCTS